MTTTTLLAGPDRPAPNAILRHALLAGVAADVLLRDHPGLGVPIWISILSLVAVSLASSSRRVLSAQAGGWLLVAVLCSAGFAWRDSEVLQFLDLCAAIGALGMTALSLSDPRVALFAKRFRDTVWGSGTVLVSTVAGLIPLRLLAPENRAARRHLGPAMRAAGIAVTLLVVFGSLLRSADPIFASLVVVPGFDPDAVVAHMIVVGFVTWIVCGWARSAVIGEVGKHAAPDRFGVSLGALEITAALGTLVLLFTAFVVVQLGWFFGGERFLHERTGLTAAEYARGGFFQMVWVVILVLAVLLGTRALLRPGRTLAWRHTALSLPVVVLLGVIIASAALRMQLYVRYFGLTTDRLCTLVFMGWLGIVLVWFCCTVLRGWGRPFVAGAVLSGLVMLAGLNLAVPDVIVARVNLARASRPSSEMRPPLDLLHLASLSGEAAELAIAAILVEPDTPPAEGYAASDRCSAAKGLLARWGSLSPSVTRGRRPASWRSWNAGEVSAMRTVTAHADQLRAVCRG